MLEWLDDIEQGKALLCKKHNCKNFAEYSYKFGLIEEVYTGIWPFRRCVSRKRDMVKTFRHIFKALKEEDKENELSRRSQT